MRAIEVVADLQALNQWAEESRIASKADDPRRAPHSARSTNSEHLGNEFGRPSSSERGLSKSLPLSQLSLEGASVARSSTTSDRISEDVFRGVRSSSRLAESDIAERSRDISRSSTRKSTLELPRSSNRPSTSPNSSSRPSALTDMPALPASDPLSSLPKLLRQISAATDDSQAPSSPSGFDLALQDAISSTSRATATYADNQLVLVPQNCAARQTPKMRKLKADLLRTHPWLQELQRAAESGSVPGSPVNRLQPPQAASMPSLPPLDSFRR